MVGRDGNRSTEIFFERPVNLFVAVRELRGLSDVEDAGLLKVFGSTPGELEKGSRNIQAFEDSGQVYFAVTTGATDPHVGRIFYVVGPSGVRQLTKEEATRLPAIAAGELPAEVWHRQVPEAATPEKFRMDPKLKR